MSDTQAIDWESRYRDGNTGWERPGLNPAFLAWRESGALAPCRILVPGGGRSVEPVAMADGGFDVTVVDAAASAVAAQRARLERLNVAARVEQADLLAWNPAAPFDAIYDQTCLCALPPAILPDYATRLHRWLRPGGTLFILFMQTGGPAARRSTAIWTTCGCCLAMRSGSGRRNCRRWWRIRPAGWSNRPC